MSKVDDELSRRFHRAERPVGSDDLFEGLALRRRRRRSLQRLEAGALAVVVLAGTVAGFAALQRAFDEGPDRVGSPPPGNGEIVFVREGDDARLHLYASQPDGSGLRQLTEGDTNDADPVVSPNGTAVAFARGIGTGRATIATVPIEGGTVAWQTAERYDVTDPTWSPDGSRVAFVGHTRDAVAELYVANVETDREQRIDLAVETTEVAHPTWSPDGSRIAIAVLTRAGTPAISLDLATIAPDGTGLEWIATTEGLDEEAPAWSPDGSRIAFLRPGDEGHEVWTVAPDGSDATRIATAVEATLGFDLDWAPDGSSLLVSDGDFVYRVDATPDGDVRDNFVQLMRGFSPSWQPIPPDARASVTTSPEASVSPTPDPEGVDVGLGFTLCGSKRLGGIDFLGTGTNGYAWVGVPSKHDGTCPKVHGAGAYVVAADADGDGQAETSTELPWRCYIDCVPYDATDLDRDGAEELIVATTFSIVDFHVMRYLGPPDEPSPVIVPILVAEPGHPPAGVEAGKPLRIDAGGDAGYSSEILCEPPVLAWTWSFAPVDSHEPTEVHSVELEIHEGEFVVVGANDTAVPPGEPTGVGDETRPSCGVDWHPNA